jgi:hypothetical protein
MAKVKGGIRTNQAVTTYGVGALVAVGDESFIVAGLDRWPIDGPDIQEPRLQRELHVAGFARPRATDDGDVPVMRFPRWHYCPSCNRLGDHSDFGGFDDHRCTACPDEPNLVPSRFVVSCERGHLTDFPYFKWVHADTLRTGDERHRLYFKASGLTASLRDIVIECSCGKAASMDGAFGKRALAEFGHCSGKRPWIDNENEACTLIPRTLQRGASNVWFSIVHSAISIPPWSEAAFRILGKGWKFLKSVPDNALEASIRGYLEAEGMADLDISVTDIAEAVRTRKRQDAGEQGDDPLRAQEYDALLKGREEISAHQDFVCINAPSSALAKEWFDSVMTVARLREVRALTGFTRLFPLGQASIPPDEQVAPLSSGDTSWLPAIDVIGEGVFLTLNVARLEVWETSAIVRSRAEVIARHFQRRAEQFGFPSVRKITPRLILIHTLAHALIDQWSLDCGYPTASLRERLYVEDNARGFLIYTATSDSAGSLGGVVAMASVERFDTSLKEAIRRTSWCSADPLCVEAGTQGVDSLNLAACHACVLLPETCCEEMNVLLDRATLVGTPDQPELGFFADMLH